MQQLKRAFEYLKRKARLYWLRFRIAEDQLYRYSIARMLTYFSGQLIVGTVLAALTGMPVFSPWLILAFASFVSLPLLISMTFSENRNALSLHRRFMNYLLTVGLALSLLSLGPMLATLITTIPLAMTIFTVATLVTVMQTAALFNHALFSRFHLNRIGRYLVDSLIFGALFTGTLGVLSAVFAWGTPVLAILGYYLLFDLTLGLLTDVFKGVEYTSIIKSIVLEFAGIYSKSWLSSSSSHIVKPSTALSKSQDPKFDYNEKTGTVFVKVPAEYRKSASDWNNNSTIQYGRMYTEGGIPSQDTEQYPQYQQPTFQ